MKNSVQLKNALSKALCCLLLAGAALTAQAQYYTIDQSPKQQQKAQNSEQHGYLGISAGENNCPGYFAGGIYFGLYYTEPISRWLDFQMGICSTIDKDVWSPFLVQFSTKNFSFESGLAVIYTMRNQETDDYHNGQLALPFGVQWRSNPFAIGNTYSSRIGVGLRGDVFLEGGLDAGDTFFEVYLSYEIGRSSWGIRNAIKNQFNK